MGKQAVRIILVGALTTLTLTPTLTLALGASHAQASRLATGSGCPNTGDTDPAVDGFPGRMSTLLGRDIRTGGHDCFERVVLELQGRGDLPGYSVRYEPDPIVLSPVGEPVDIAGDATLVLSVGAWMADPDGNGYQGPQQITPTNVRNILELRLIENHEGQHQWAIGLDRERNFRVTTLTEPVRIVIDIALDPAGPTPTLAPPTTSVIGPVLPPTI